MTLRALCTQRTDLAETDIQQLEQLERNLSAIAALTGGDVFIDCLDSHRHAFVAAHAVPQCCPSKYATDVLGLTAHRQDEPAVYAAFAQAAPFHDTVANTQESKPVRQDVTPIKNEVGSVIAVLICERDISRETVMARKLDAMDAQLFELPPAANRDEAMQTREAHHRIKNHLQILSSICAMRARTPGQAEETREALQEIGRILRSVAGLHELMSQPSKTSGQRLDLSAILSSLVSGLRELTEPLRPTRFRLECAPVSIDVRQATSIVLVVNELVTNAITHSDPTGELYVYINLQRGNEYSTIVVSDNCKAPSLRMIPGMGLQIVRSLVEDNLHGQFNIEFTATGTKASFCFETNPVF